MVFSRGIAGMVSNVGDERNWKARFFFFFFFFDVLMKTKKVLDRNAAPVVATTMQATARSPP